MYTIYLHCCLLRYHFYCHFYYHFYLHYLKGTCNYMYNTVHLYEACQSLTRSVMTYHYQEILVICRVILAWLKFPWFPPFFPNCCIITIRWVEFQFNNFAEYAWKSKMCNVYMSIIPSLLSPLPLLLPLLLPLSGNNNVIDMLLWLCSALN